MLKKHLQKFWLHYLISVALIFVAVTLYNDNKSPSKDLSTNKGGSAGNGNGSDPIYFTNPFYHSGMDLNKNIGLPATNTGAEVAEVQKIMNTTISRYDGKAYLLTPVDGNWGAKTQALFVELQGLTGIFADTITISEAQSFFGNAYPST